MITRYTQALEKIIEKMKESLDQGRTDVIQSEYTIWLDFLRKLHPESALLKNVEDISIDDEFDKPIRETSDIHDITTMAEELQYPTWYIQPKFSDDRFIFEYQEGQLKSVMQTSLIHDINTISGFTGKISGQIHNSQFFACDIDRHTQFLKKIDYIQKFKFNTPEFILFPTNKLPTISSTKLEGMFHNYISKAQEGGLKVDGVVIVSDTPLFSEDKDRNSRRIAFTV